jgi:HEAT repeat protein
MFRRIRRLRIFAVRRALPVAHFGKLAPKYAEVLLGEALQDPSPYVTRPAVSALGKTLSPLAVPILLEQLRQASEGQSEIPVRSAKAALVRHSTDQLQDFLLFLENPEDRFRLLVVDTIREMLAAKPSLANMDSFPRDLYHWFIHQARFDASADVRARSAAIVGRFHDTNSIATLRAMLRDENEYVRLHAARACADPFYSELVNDLVECITDRRWRVRESVAKSLAAVGTPGAQALADFFLATSDRYASEQIADELQRSGLILQLVPMLGSSDLEADKAAAVCGKMAGLGMTSLFRFLLQHETEITVRNELLKILASCPECALADSQPTPMKPDHLPMDNAAPFLGMTGARTPIAAGK